MPGSRRENDADVREFIATHNIKTVLDVGPGRGTYARVLDGLDLEMDCVEIWGRYLTRYQLDTKYRHAWVHDVRQWADFDYDLVIFGDVLEHMTRDQSLEVWRRCGLQARYGMISVPIVHYPQGESHGNPYEAHVQEHVHATDVRVDYGPFILDREYQVTGTFIRKF